MQYLFSQYPLKKGPGVEAGSKTGLTAVIVGLYFFVAIFFAPILASIPPWAIGGALILVGALMARSLTKLNFNKVSHALSGFLTVMVMPLTYSITNGLIAGIGAYVIIEGVFLLLSLVGIKVPGEIDRMRVAPDPAQVTDANNSDGDVVEETKQASTNEDEESFPAVYIAQ